MNLDTLKSIQTRIRNATGPDRELDADIALIFGNWQKTVLPVLNMNGSTEVTTVWHPTEWSARDWWDENAYRLEMGDGEQDLPRVTASLDACVALMAAVLPGWTRAVDATAPEYGIDVELFAPGMGSSVGHKETHDLEMHATLLAIFSAAIADLEARGEAA